MEFFRHTGGDLRRIWTPQVRACCSGLAQADQWVIERAVRALASDLDAGAWEPEEQGTLGNEKFRCGLSAAGLIRDVTTQNQFHDRPAGTDCQSLNHCGRLRRRLESKSATARPTSAQSATNTRDASSATHSKTTCAPNSYLTPSTRRRRLGTTTWRAQFFTSIVRICGPVIPGVVTLTPTTASKRSATRSR